MASEKILKELFQVSMSSDYFEGMTKDEVWKACLSYKDRPDSHIKIAMENIKKQDVEAGEKSEKKQISIKKNQKIIKTLRSQEKSDRKKDVIIAESILDNFFKA